MVFYENNLPRWMYILIPIAVVGMILDFHYGGEIVLKNFLSIMLFIGQTALTGWLAIAALLYFVISPAIKNIFARRRS